MSKLSKYDHSVMTKVYQESRPLQQV